jgi:acyl-coenzyme A thioesterase PaaI-like protein
MGAFFSKLSTRNAFFNKICSLIWLPYAFRSGISFRQLDKDTFTAKLPFRRFNRNWYNAMAGAALLGNSEVAAGMYLFAECGSDYVVICKEMRYRFLRPCFGPAIYRIVNCEDLTTKVSDGGEFNIELEMAITQHMQKKQGKDRRVGRCYITFHCTPKEMYNGRRVRGGNRDRNASAPQVTIEHKPESDSEQAAEHKDTAQST